MVEIFWLLGGFFLISTIIYVAVYAAYLSLPILFLFVDVFKFFLSMLGTHNSSYTLFITVLYVWITFLLYDFVKSFTSKDSPTVKK